jgi:hypothetical protein
VAGLGGFTSCHISPFAGAARARGVPQAVLSRLPPGRQSVKAQSSIPQWQLAGECDERYEIPISTILRKHHPAVFSNYGGDRGN